MAQMKWGVIGSRRRQSVRQNDMKSQKDPAAQGRESVETHRWEMAGAMVSMEGKVEKGIRKAVNVLFWSICAILFMVLLFVDKSAAYPQWAKNHALLPNVALVGGLLILLALGSLVWEKWLSKNHFLGRVRRGIRKGFYPILGILCVLLFVLQVYIAHHLYFIAGWDVAIVTGTADWLWTGERGIGSEYYFSQYPNNVAIVYILAVIYQVAVKLGFEVYRYFVTILVDCVLIDLAGFFVALSVKRLTGSCKAALLAWGIFVGLTGINPWMVIPYTDTFSVLFPVLSFYLYLCARQAHGRMRECVLWAAAGVAGMTGYLIKPSAGIVLIAIVCNELLVLAAVRSRRREALLHLGMILAAFIVSRGLWLHMLDYTGSDLDREVAFSYAHYLMLGLNEENTGAYSSGDYLFSLSIPDRKTRVRENLRMVSQRIREYGVGGYLEFMGRKLLLNYNDGVFAWEQEGGFEMSERNAPVTLAFQRVRRLFRCGTDWYGYYATFAQALWLLVLFAMPFAGAGKSAKIRTDGAFILRVSLIGSFLFVMLFEARARYLYNMAPVYIVGAAAGLWKISCWLAVRKNGKGHT